jgi:hypothetical protein
MIGFVAFGAMGYWNNGILECWNVGMLGVAEFDLN